MGAQRMCQIAVKTALIQRQKACCIRVVLRLNVERQPRANGLRFKTGGREIGADNSRQTVLGRRRRRQGGAHFGAVIAQNLPHRGQKHLILATKIVMRQPGRHAGTLRNGADRHIQRGSKGKRHGIMPSRGKTCDEEQNAEFIERRPNPHGNGEWRKANGDCDRQHANHNRCWHLVCCHLCGQVGTGKQHGCDQHRKMPSVKFAKSGTQDDDRADQGAKNSDDTAPCHAFAKDENRKNADINRIEVVHRRDFGDRDSRHGIKPEDHRNRMAKSRAIRTTANGAALTWCAALRATSESGKQAPEYTAPVRIIHKTPATGREGCLVIPDINTRAPSVARAGHFKTKDKAMAHIVRPMITSRTCHARGLTNNGRNSRAPYPREKKKTNDDSIAPTANIKRLGYCADIAPIRTTVSKYTCGFNHVSAKSVITADIMDCVP
ncbi:hypothetical protein GQR58_000519 [Nymphon striatum]|nr:hypothetical protein GQR58_000519 [Nymphon striatum]